MYRRNLKSLLCGILFVMAAGTASGKENITIGSVIMNNSGEWFSEALRGQQDAADDLGVECIFTSSDNEISKEFDNVALFISEQIDALVISPLAKEASVPTIENAMKKADIPVVTWNTTADIAVASHIGVDSAALGGNTGKVAADYIKDQSMEHCSLAVIGNSNYEVGIARCNGFKDALQELITAGTVEIVYEQDAEFLDESHDLTLELLQKKPDIEMIWCWNQVSMLGCVAAVREAGRSDIILLGTDMSSELARDMLEDEVTILAITTQMPYEMGYCAIENAVKAVRGEPVEQEVLIPVYTYTKDQQEEIRSYIAEFEERE